MVNIQKKRHLTIILRIFIFISVVFLLINYLSNFSVNPDRNSAKINAAVYLKSYLTDENVNLSDKINVYLSPEPKNNSIIRNFIWKYDNSTYNISFVLSPELDYIFRQRVRTRDYDLFASDNYSMPLVRSITKQLKDFGNKSGINNVEMPNFIISFIQNLSYTSDRETTGFDEYPRFPYETIYDGGGDCEDTSILASSILKELGYKVALLQFPNHVAVGLKCFPNNNQKYVEFENISYCYLETNGGGWKIGQVPDDVNISQAIVKPLIQHPVLSIDFNSNYYYDWLRAYVKVNVKATNLGSEVAKNASLHVSLQKPESKDEWDHIDTKPFDIGPENVYEFNISDLKLKTGRNFRVYIRLNATNVEQVEAYSGWLYWDFSTDRFKAVI
jgi:hypothetical protein